MGDIGPIRQHYEVLPAPAFGLEDADAWTAPVRMTVPSPGPMPVPHPEPGPDPIPSPEPRPEPGPGPVPPSQRPTGDGRG